MNIICHKGIIVSVLSDNGPVVMFLKESLSLNRLNFGR